MAKTKALITLQDIYGQDMDWASSYVQEDLKNLAIAVLRRALTGEKIPGEQFKAMEIVVSKAIWKHDIPRNVNVWTVSEEQVTEAKRRAGLLTS